MADRPIASRPILVGMPGAGKSSIARHLGRRLDLAVIDTDSVIEERIGTTIRAYFASHGQEAFRDKEEQIIEELLQGPPAVLATGGGAVLRASNRARLHQGGCVIYLRLSAEKLYKRLRNDNKRPLLQVDDPLALLQTMLAEREPLYQECAHFTVDVSGASLSMLVNRVIMQLDLMKL